MRLLAVPRLPLLPDPLRRVRVPSDLESVTTFGVEEDSRAVGMQPEAIERIWGAAQGLYRSGVHPAVGLCLRREGEVVLDRAIGHARGNGPQDPPDAEKLLATPQTPQVIFSASKAITAMVVHLLDERGQIHVGDRVSDYIPEFARHGKEAITIAHLLSHRAGVPNVPPSLLDLDNIEDQGPILEGLYDQQSRSRPGKALAYHAVSGGFLLGEIVRRITGQDIREVLGSEILEPLGFRWNNYGVKASDLPLVARSYNTGAPVLPPVSTLLERALGAPVGKSPNSPTTPGFSAASCRPETSSPPPTSSRASSSCCAAGGRWTGCGSLRRGPSAGHCPSSPIWRSI